MIESLADSIQTWGEPLAGIGSLVLSGALVLLYRKQHKLQKSNFEADHRAVVDIESYQSLKKDFNLYLSNVGNGVATDLELITVTVLPESAPLASGVTTNRVSKKLVQGGKGRQSIKAGEDNEEYYSRPAIPIGNKGGSATRYSVDTGIAKLVREDVGVVRIHCFIRYRDLRNQYSVRYLSGWELEPDNDLEYWGELVDRGGEMIFGEPDVDPETLQLDLSDAVTKNSRTVV